MGPLEALLQQREDNRTPDEKRRDQLLEREISAMKCAATFTQEWTLKNCADLSQLTDMLNSSFDQLYNFSIRINTGLDDKRKQLTEENSQ